MNKELNYIILYGIVGKVRKNFVKIDFGYGKIKVFTENEEIDFAQLKEGYTISLSGRFRAGFIRHYIIADTVTIFDKKPHKIPFEV